MSDHHPEGKAMDAICEIMGTMLTEDIYLYMHQKSFRQPWKVQVMVMDMLAMTRAMGANLWVL